MTLTAGEQLGPYEIVSLLGEGGMGEVYRARDTRLNRLVAIKVAKETFTARFLKEAQAIASLNHPHICILYDVGPDYLIMEYVEGTPLEGPLPLDKALPLALQMVKALEEAHLKGIVHRDLKPSNILVTASGIKLLDFGLAKVESPAAEDGLTVTRTGTIVGTPAYMSPEQASGLPADHRSDIFSFGAVFYEMITGNRAFRGESQASTLAAVLRDDPSPMKSSRSLSELVMRCLRKNASERFQSASELRRALESLHIQPEDTRPSIAVLPFANLSRDEDGEFFSDGLAEEIIHALAQVPNLRVIARTSAFAFKGRNEDIRNIALALGVTHILEGSVRRAKSRIRVTAQLITAADGSQLWSQRYDGELADVFSIQDEMANAIVAALEIRLAGRRTGPERFTPKLAAYEAFLRARHGSFAYTPESMAKTRAAYERAIELEPGYALAHAELGMQILSAALPGVVPAREAFPAARAAAEKALALDPFLPEARAVLGAAAGLLEYDWNEAGRQFLLATAAEPIPPYVRQLFGGFHLLTLGRAEQAMRELQIATAEDPLNFAARLNMGFCLFSLSRFAEVEALLSDLAVQHPGAFQPYHFLAISKGTQGRYSEAVPFARKAHAIAPRHAHPAAVLAAVLAETQEPEEAAAILEGLPPAHHYGVPMALTLYHLLRDQPEEAAAWASQAVDQRDPRLVLGFHFPMAASLRASANGQLLSARMNLPASVCAR